MRSAGLVMGKSLGYLRTTCATALAAVLGACANLPPLNEATAQAARPCRAFFAQLDDRIAAAGVGDAGYARIPGYPYLRADRFLASFAHEVADGRAFDAWVDGLRLRDLEARRAELRNLGAADADALLARSAACGAELAQLELASPARRADLRARVRVPDDYAWTARVLGFYPAAVPFLNLGIRRYHAAVRRDYARPLATLDSPGPLMVWVPARTADTADDADGALAAAPRDALGIPQLDAQVWRRLVERHAPVWWIETGGDYDRPGAPRWDRHGRPGVDPAHPVVYYRTDYTRLGKAVLPTLSYIVWFSERPPQKTLDPYAGALDGLIWRVVLDPWGQPLVYDSIHPCGCYRYFFPAQALQRQAQGGFWQEPVLFPQADVPPPPLALRIQSQTHALRRVVAAAQAQGERRHYVLQPYAALLTLPHEAGSRSLFGPDGLVAGTERGERWWLWVAGVPEPGAMRQWGRHATAFVGRSHFDDVRFLEQQFAVPEWAR